MVTFFRILSLVVLLMLTTRVYADEDERRAATYVRKHGGRVDYFPGEPARHASFSWHSSLTDEGVKRLTAFKHLKSLRLHSLKVTNQCVPYLAELKELELLSLGGQVTDAGLKPLAALKKLQVLRLPHKVTGTGLKDLLVLEHLRELNADKDMFNDEGLKFVGQMKNLEKLNLHYTKITDDGLKHLVGLKKLRYLDLGANDITDKSMKTLAALTELRELRLDGNRGITGANFDDLAPLQKLWGLDLGSMHNLHAVNIKKLLVLKNLKGLNVRGSVAIGSFTIPGAHITTRDPDEDDRHPGQGQHQDAPLPQDGTAHIMVHVMSGAEIWFDDDKTSQTGRVRSFVSPALTPGKHYSYTIRARWQENGKPVEQTRMVEVQANRRTVVDFSKEATPTPKQKR